MLHGDGDRGTSPRAAPPAFGQSLYDDWSRAFTLASGGALDASSEHVSVMTSCASHRAAHFRLLYWRSAAIATRTSTTYINAATTTGIWPSLAHAAGPATRNAARRNQRQPPQPDDERTSVLPVTLPCASRVSHVWRLIDSASRIVPVRQQEVADSVHVDKGALGGRQQSVAGMYRRLASRTDKPCARACQRAGSGRSAPTHFLCYPASQARQSALASTI